MIGTEITSKNEFGKAKRDNKDDERAPFQFWEFEKKQFFPDIHAIVAMEEIPKELIINWDQTGMKYVPVSNWTFETKGSKNVEIAGVDVSDQITVHIGWKAPSYTSNIYWQNTCLFTKRWLSYRLVFDLFSKPLVKSAYNDGIPA